MVNYKFILYAFKQLKFQKLILPLFILSLTLNGCSLFSSPEKYNAKAAQDVIDFGPPEDDVTPGGSGNPADPSSGGTRIDPGEDDTCVNASIEIQGPNPIQFSHNQYVELENKDKILECQTISVTGCHITFTAEIQVDENRGVYINPENQEEKIQQFVLRSKGNISEGRLSGIENSVDVCYRRLGDKESIENGQDHSSVLSIVVGSGSHVRLFRITGSTVPLIFNIEQPRKNQLVWEQDWRSPPQPGINRIARGHIPTDSENGTRPYLQYLHLKAAGSIIFDPRLFEPNAPHQLTIAVQPNGVTRTITLPEDGSFNLSSIDPAANENQKAIEVPYRPAGTYNVNFCIDTKKGNICQKIPVIRYAAPMGSVNVINESDEVVSVIEDTGDVKPTDSRTLKLKIDISNLDVSGPETFPRTVEVNDNGEEEESSNRLNFIFGPMLMIKRVDTINRVEPVEDPQDFGNLASYDFCPDNREGMWEFCEHGNCLVGRNELPILYTGMKNSCDDQELRGNKNFCTKESSLYYDLDVHQDLHKGINRFEVQACNFYTSLGCDFKCAQFSTTIILDNDKPIIDCSNPKENFYSDFGTRSTLRCTVKNFKQQDQESGECFVKLWVNQPNFDEDNKDSGYQICPQIVQGFDRSLNNGNYGNVREAFFEVPLVNLEDGEDSVGRHRQANAQYTVIQKLDGDEYVEVDQINKLVRYTNLLQIRAQDNNGHLSYKTISFQKGEFKKSTVTSRGGNKAVIKTGRLGHYMNHGETTKGSPLMLALTEKTLTDPKMIAVIEHLFNDPEDGFKFSDLIQGGAIPGDEDGNNVEDEDEELDIYKYLSKPADQDFFLFNDPNDLKKKRWIWQNIHSSMPQKFAALEHYRTLRIINDNFDPLDAQNIFFNAGCSERSREDILNFEESWNVACDSCRNLISTAVVNYDTFKFALEKTLDGVRDINRSTAMNPLWPRTCMLNTEQCLNNPDSCRADLNCNDTVQGKWRIGKLDLKDNGFIDADICILGDGQWNDIHNTPNNPCDDVPGEGSHGPAYWSSTSLIGLIEGGVTEIENDPIIPAIWNIGKLRLNLRDVLQLKKVRLNNGEFTNKLIVYKNRINIDINNNATIRLEPYLECAEFYRQNYQKRLPENLRNRFPMPHGCSDRGEIYPLLLDRTAPLGEIVWIDLTQRGNNFGLLALLREKILQTFRNMISCLIEERVNPIINQTVFPFPPWLADKEKEDLDFTKIAVDDTDDGVEIAVPASDATNPIFSLQIDPGTADIEVTDDFLKVKLPLESVSAEDVALSRNGVDALNNTRTRANGFMSRDLASFAANFESTHPFALVDDAPYLGLSLGIEDVLNSLIHLLFQDGPLRRLDLIDEDLVEDLAIEDNWEIRLDKVILGNFDICGDLAGILPSSLPPNTIMNSLSNLFSDGGKFSHLSLKLDRNQPATLAIEPVDIPNLAEGQSAAYLRVGLTNVAVSIHDFKKVREGQEIFEIGDEIAKLRMDLSLLLGIKYQQDSSMIRLEIFVDPASLVYLSVINGGGTFNDQEVIADLKSNVFNTAFGWLTSNILQSPNNPTFAINLPLKLEYFDNESVFIKKKDLTIPTEWQDLDDDGQLYRLKTDNGKLIRVVIQDFSSLGTNGKCEEGATRAQYGREARRQNNINPGRIGNGIGNGLGVSRIIPGIIPIIDFHIPEDCGNRQDDNNNNLVDCNDPGCHDVVSCQPENCNNEIDDNDNDLIDCNDPQCDEAGYCQPIDDPVAERENIPIANEDHCHRLETELEESLCEDLGIKSIDLGTPETPLRIELDAEHGYIHVDAGLAIEIYDWLTEEFGEEE